jgi:polyribonucleotide nucleotidyltransferase
MLMTKTHKMKASRKSITLKTEGYVARPPRESNGRDRRGRDNRGRDNRRDDRKPREDKKEE